MADVLIVDDDVEIAELLAEALALRRHRVRIAHNGESGLCELARRRPDVVLLDVEMPLLDGPGMARQMFLLNSGFERVPIVLVSGIAELTAVATRVGTPYFLSKPYSLTKLFSVCERALNERIAPKPEVIRH